MFRDFVSRYRKGLEQCYDELPIEKLERLAQILSKARSMGRRVFFLGNGGSASTASHMAVDFGKGVAISQQRRLKALSLTDNVGLITAWANDASYSGIFREQLENLLEPLDVVVAISASGNSPNVLEAVEFARSRGAVTIGLIGSGGGRLKELVDIDITVSSRNYGQVEDVHLTIDHILSQYLRELVHRGAEETRTDGVPYLKFFFSEPPSFGHNAAVLFDRDGVINERVVGGYVTDWKQFRFRDGIKNAMAAVAKLGLPIIVVSNQACVGKRFLSCAALAEITKQFVADLRQSEVRIDAVYYCPHTPDEDCACRKPRPGLIEAAARDWKLDLSQSVLVGDSESDIEVARKLNCRAVFVSSGSDDSTAPIQFGWEVRTVRNVSELSAAIAKFFSSIPSIP